MKNSTTRVLWLAPLLMAICGISNYAGAAVAVGLFAELPAWLVAWMRMTASALILLAIWRPHPRTFFGKAGALSFFYGIATFGMNSSFYEAIARLPLGTVVAIEFIGPIVVAAVGSRSIRDWVALLLAAAGVLVLSGVQWEGNALGVIFALGAATLWAVYIVLGAKISANAKTSAASMSVGFTWAAVVSLPVALWGFWHAGPTHYSWTSLLAIALVLGALSSVIPYSLDQVILRMAGPAYFSVLLAMMPALSTIIGVAVLGQSVKLIELVGMACVIVAVLLREPAGKKKNTVVDTAEPMDPERS